MCRLGRSKVPEKVFWKGKTWLCLSRRWDIIVDIAVSIVDCRYEAGINISNASAKDINVNFRPLKMELDVGSCSWKCHFQVTLSKESCERLLWSTKILVSSPRNFYHRTDWAVTIIDSCCFWSWTIKFILVLSGT